MNVTFLPLEIWELTPWIWARIYDSIEAVKTYIWKTYNKDIKLKYISRKNNELEDILDLWYMVSLWIHVNKDFIEDTKDWNIDETNYFNFTKSKR